jgi:anti-sigma factor RsiW
MSHLDEGTLHALLDGELDLTEVSEVQLHLGTCVACGSRLQEVKQVLAEADRLVGGVEMPAGPARARPEPPRRPPAGPSRDSDGWGEPPVLLLPDSGEANAWRARWMRGIGWAAVIAVVLGAGRMITTMMSPGQPAPTERDLTSATPTVAPAVVSQEERRRPDTPAAGQRGKSSRPTSQNRPPTQRAAPRRDALRVEAPVLDTATEYADASAAPANDTVAADSGARAMEAAPDTAGKPEVASATDTVSEARPQASAQSREEEDLATRRAAAIALAELDRERLRERANAATAALPPVRPETPPESAPAPRTLEQRSQIYLRIGLDEAAKQLGRPVHVIEGMTPQFIGLTRGQLVPGANPRRPVVRVVYLDSRGRMILLDQQRMDTSEPAGAPAGNLRWSIGDVMLYLRGEPGQDVLRSLQARVR